MIILLIEKGYGILFFLNDTVCILYIFKLYYYDYTMSYVNNLIFYFYKLLIYFKIYI